jgi:hypothetical protein
MKDELPDVSIGQSTYPFGRQHPSMAPSVGVLPNKNQFHDGSKWGDGPAFSWVAHSAETSFILEHQTERTIQDIVLSCFIQ